MPRSLNPSEQGARNEFVFHYEPGVPMLGHRRRGDASTIRLPHFEFLQNVRFGDGLGGRPGSQLALNGLGAKTTSLYDFQTTGPEGKLYVLYNGVPGCTLPIGFAGFSINWFDFDTAAGFARGVAYSGTDSVAMAVFNGDLYIGVDGVLKRFITINPDYEDEAIFIAGFDQSEDLKDFGALNIRSLYSAFGELYIGLDGGNGASKIVRYDGVTFRDDDTAIDPPISMFLFRNELLVVGIETNGLRIRDDQGVWTPVAGAIAPTKMESFRDNLYLVQDDEDIWKYNGTVLAVDHTIADARIAGLCLCNDMLFFGYGDTIAEEAIIGTLDDGNVYTDVHKNITTQSLDDDFELAQRVSQLSFYRGGIIAGVANDDPLVTYGGRLMFGEGADTDGNWTALTPYDPAKPEFQIIVAFETF